MKIENGKLIIFRHDLDHIMGGHFSDIPSVDFEEGLKDELYMSGLQDTPYESIEIRLEPVLNWKKAEEHLLFMQREYLAIGPVGYFGLTFGIMPLLNRFNNGERTQELYDEIMETKE